MNCRKSKTDQDHPDHSDSLSEPSEPSEQPEMDSQVTPKALHGEFIMEDDLINIHSTYPQSSAHKHRYLAIIATIWEHHGNCNCTNRAMGHLPVIETKTAILTLPNKGSKYHTYFNRRGNLPTRCGINSSSELTPHSLQSTEMNVTNPCCLRFELQRIFLPSPEPWRRCGSLANLTPSAKMSVT